MLETLISSRTRIKLLLKFFVNPRSTAYLRGLAEEFNESTNAIRVELNRFEGAGMLVTETQGNKKVYKANNQHPLFSDLQKIILKYIGIDRIIETVIGRMGQLEQLYLIGDYARGKDTGIIDLVFIGALDKEYLHSLISKAEGLVSRKIRYLIYSQEEWQHENNAPDKYLLLWDKTNAFE
ncbi:MAG: winged helix-turn-helix transcriptional regulator [Taibaiella sp.]|nr:winged helix-turn-helix transcriptional regulator [Taibaiella sp.]